MKIEGTFVDHYALQVIANILENDIIIIPSKAESAHILNKYSVVKANVLTNMTPIYMLWYEETVHGVGHYQSIQPVSDNIVSRHYTWSLKNQDSRIVNREQSEIRARLPSFALSVNSEIPEIPVINSSTNESNVSVVKTCHICEKKYTKASKKKICSCKKFCHVKCFGNCNV